MIPLAVPNLTGNERKYLNNCIDTTFVSSVGEYVNCIEKMMAEICGAQYAVSTSSGTTGLHLALIGCGVSRDDIVIIPSFTFIATANAVSHCGATPWLMDISSDSWTINVEQIENELKHKTEWKDDVLYHRETHQRIAAIMPVYTLGNIPDMERLRQIANQYKLPIIADAAAAVGSTYKNGKIGNLADLTVFSFNGNKTVTSGGGGMIVGNNQELMSRLKHLSTTARVSAEYDHDMVGYNYRMTNIQAAVGCAQLERVDEFVKRKREVRQAYAEAFGGLKEIFVFPEAENVQSSCWFSGIVYKEGGIEDVRKMCQHLKEHDIEARSFWKPIHLQKPYLKALKADKLDVSDGVWNRIVTLPCSTGITDKELMCVIDAVKQIVQ